jgi:hypothetical protein
MREELLVRLQEYVRRYDYWQLRTVGGSFEEFAPMDSADYMCTTFLHP